MQLPEEIRDFLEQTSFAVLCVAVDLGEGDEVVVFVKSSRDLTEALREASVPVQLGWVAESTPRGPCVCLVIQAKAPLVGEFVGETYFDPADEGDRRLLRLLAQQTRVQIAFLDEDLAIPWLVELPWDEVRRLEAEQVWDRAESWLERTRDYDFLAAKEFFQADAGLDGLVAKAFPDRRGPA